MVLNIPIFFGRLSRVLNIPIFFGGRLSMVLNIPIFLGPQKNIGIFSTVESLPIESLPPKICISVIL
jgi:hypothetical protein